MTPAGAPPIRVPWAGRPLWASVVTVNDDFTTPLASNVPYLARELQPLAFMAQESKTHDYRLMLGPNWHVRQFLGSEAKAGVAVIINTRLGTPIGRHSSDDPRQVGWGYQVLCRRDRGDAMLDRGIVWQDLVVGDNRRRMCRVGAMHRPPGRESDNWAEFDTNFRAWASRSPLPVIVGVDANDPDPDQLLGPHLRWTGRGIDGWVHDKDLAIRRGEIQVLPKRTSDHHPLLAGVRIPPIRPALDWRPA